MHCQAYYAQTATKTAPRLLRAGRAGDGKFSAAGGSQSARQNVTVRAKQSKSEQVSYGANWYEQTKSRPRSVREELERRKATNELANNGRERKDLYTDNWDGSEYKGSNVNILTIILAVSVAVPALGLVFAYATFGTLWG